MILRRQEMTMENTQNTQSLHESLLIEETLNWLSTRCFNETISEAITNITGYRVSGKNIIAPDGTSAEFKRLRPTKHINTKPAIMRTVQRLIKSSFGTKYVPALTAYNESRNELYMLSASEFDETKPELFMIRIYESRSGKRLLADLYKAESNRVITFKLVTKRNDPKRRNKDES